MPNANEALSLSAVQSPRAVSDRIGPGRPDYAAIPLTFRDFALLVIQLALLTIVVWQFHLEEKRHLLSALLAVLGGFVVNTKLPAAFRRAWFLAVSVGCLLIVLGLQDGFLALSVAATLIAVTRLPASVGLRSIVLIALGAGFSWLRWKSTSVFWPIVGSMFMFRTISYMQALRRERIQPSLVDTASYFLMLPNVFFPLFPVVDAKVFVQSYSI